MLTTEERDQIRSDYTNEQSGQFYRNIEFLDGDDLRQLLADLDAKDAEIAALQDELLQKPGSLVVQLARANERIAKLKRERDDLHSHINVAREVGTVERDNLRAQLTKAEAALRWISNPPKNEFVMAGPQICVAKARAYFAAKERKDAAE